MLSSPSKRPIKLESSRFRSRWDWVVSTIAQNWRIMVGDIIVAQGTERTERGNVEGMEIERIQDSEMLKRNKSEDEDAIESVVHSGLRL
jgi:hypothetical protein